MTLHSSLRGRLGWLCFLLLLGSGWTAHAQLSVDVQIKRRLFIINEPILATVTITNQTGREIILADTTEGGPWFSFQITGADGRLVPPRNPNYELQPLAMHPGETVKRTVNLNELYAMGDFGTFHFRSSVYFAAVGKYFGSKIMPLELTDGKVIWSQTVGVPEGLEDGGDQYRTFSLLTLEVDGGRTLYVREQGQAHGTIFACYSLGRLITGQNPDAKFDGSNNLDVLYMVAPKAYSLFRMGIDGSFLDQTAYVSVKSEPFLRKTTEGRLQIVGATRQEAVAQVKQDNAPKLSERPPGF